MNQTKESSHKEVANWLFMLSPFITAVLCVGGGMYTASDFDVTITGTEIAFIIKILMITGILPVAVVVTLVLGIVAIKLPDHRKGLGTAISIWSLFTAFLSYQIIYGVATAG